MRITTDLEKLFKDADWALLVGAAPRQAGMERSELLDKNGAIFAEQVPATSLSSYRLFTPNPSLPVRSMASPTPP